MPPKKGDDKAKAKNHDMEFKPTYAQRYMLGYDILLGRLGIKTAPSRSATESGSTKMGGRQAGMEVNPADQTGKEESTKSPTTKEETGDVHMTEGNKKTEGSSPKGQSMQTTTESTLFDRMRTWRPRIWWPQIFNPLPNEDLFIATCRMLEEGVYLNVWASIIKRLALICDQRFTLRCGLLST